MHTGAACRRDGMLRKGDALAEGTVRCGTRHRLTGDRERATSNWLAGHARPCTAAQAGHEGQSCRAGDPMEMYPKTPGKEENSGLPQDMWMPWMNVTRSPRITASQGLERGMMGMMTMVRVLPPESCQIMRWLEDRRAGARAKKARRTSCWPRVAVSESTGKLTVNTGISKGGWARCPCVARISRKS